MRWNQITEPFQGSFGPSPNPLDSWPWVTSRHPRSPSTMWSFFSEWSTSWAKNSRWASWYWSCPQSGEAPYAHHAHWIVGFWREDDVRLMMSRKCPIAICSLVQPLLECLVEIWKESGNLYPFIWTWRTKFWAWLPGRTFGISVQHVRSLRSWLKRRSKRVTSAFWRRTCQGQERTAWWKVAITSEDLPVHYRLRTVLPSFFLISTTSFTLLATSHWYPMSYIHAEMGELSVGCSPLCQCVWLQTPTCQRLFVEVHICPTQTHVSSRRSSCSEDT